jgi:hypothetical protein
MNQPLISEVLAQLELLSGLKLSDWDTLVRQARRSGLLARLAETISRNELEVNVPQPARWHLRAERVLSDRQKIAVRWEVMQLREALAELNIPIILLKGAAYVMADLPAARGRLFSDVDILVPFEKINQAEAALMLAGWHAQTEDVYDERYYRQWMHEIPPMIHLKRGSVVDMHHAILPRTARYHPDPEKLRAAALPIAGQPGLFVLQPVDMVLHAACHLFHDGELPHGLRDLSDMDLLLRHFGRDVDFWEALPKRAEELELTRPLFYALRYARHFFGTPVPHTVDAVLEKAAPLLLKLMDSLFYRALGPEHDSYHDGLSRLARFAAYIRAHWLRMPPLMLARHLLHKALISRKEAPA